MNKPVFIQKYFLLKRKYWQLNKGKRCILAPYLAICFYNTIIYKKNSCICIILRVTTFFSKPSGHLARQSTDCIPVIVRVYQIYAVIFRFATIRKCKYLSYGLLFKLKFKFGFDRRTSYKRQCRQHCYYNFI